MFCVQPTFFQLESDIYQQEKGLSMSSPLSPVIENIYGRQQRNRLRNGTTKANGVAEICTLHLYNVGSLGIWTIVKLIRHLSYL